MHSYLRAIGFSNIINKQQMDNLLGEVMTTPNVKVEKIINMRERFVEISKEFCEGTGITIVGYYDSKNFFHVDHYYPFLLNDNISIEEEVYFNKEIDNIPYSCLCDDMRLGVALIFYLQNVVDYMWVFDNNKKDMISFPISLSGLSNSGKIILPVMKGEKALMKKIRKRNTREKLIAEAKKGNKEAFDKITSNDIDTYHNISKRVKNEDIYSIVDNSFYPFGEELSTYTMIGTIMKYSLISNPITNEDIYQLYVECNDVPILVCINKKDLLGVPMEGARFKGNIWLQGNIDFKKDIYP